MSFFIAYTVLHLIEVMFYLRKGDSYLHMDVVAVDSGSTGVYDGTCDRHARRKEPRGHLLLEG